MRKVLVGVMAAIMAAGMLAACGGSESSDSETVKKMRQSKVKYPIRMKKGFGCSLVQRWKRRRKL